MALLLGAALSPASEGRASDEDRDASLGAMGGLRIFNTQVGLRNDASVGLRLGLGIVPRVHILMDYALCGANRKSGTGTANVHALRALARFDFLHGSTRPYVVTGAGGVLFDFNDAQDYATGTLTVGYGVDRRLGSRTYATVEGTLDFYRNRTVVYSSTGQELSRSPRETQGVGNVALGLGFLF